ncbi:MAG TPA: NAD(P)H-binding protein, partial [Sphingomicrobium sp.]|nr:NAD(P)H-binding protein [Sphingomicrobium sp.]
LAEFLSREVPGIQLRLVSRDAIRGRELHARFPRAQVVQANYSDPASLGPAVAGMEAIFVLTPAGTDERQAMGNLVDAVRSANTNPHIIRLVGYQPEYNPHRIGQWLANQGMGLPVQHPLAKRLLDDSLLPVTYLNCGATFIDNFARWMAPALRERRTLIWPERLIPYLDPRDIAEVAGRLFLSDNHRHIGQFHTMNNGHDILRFAEVAALMSDLWGEPIAHDGSKSAFFGEYAQMGEARLQFLWEFFEYERDNEVVWARNDFVERMIGRKPTTVRDWLIAHKSEILGPK